MKQQFTISSNVKSVFLDLLRYLQDRVAKAGLQL